MAFVVEKSEHLQPFKFRRKQRTTPLISFLPQKTHSLNCMFEKAPPVRFLPVLVLISMPQLLLLKVLHRLLLQKSSTASNMMKQLAQGFPLSVLFLALLFPWSHFASAQEVEAESEFSYLAGSPNGPEHWGEIRHEWALCNNGDMQSPIDLLHERVHVSPALGRIQRSYRASNATLRNRGHDIMLRWEGGAGTIRINGTRYELRQCHWHSPSEHTIDGKRFAMEMHMVHVSADERVAVVGILYTVGRPDTFLAELMEYIEEVADRREAERAVGFVDPRHIRVGSKKYYRYMGSLTTPPCDQGVTWTITQKIRTASREQIGLLREAVHDDAEANARPVQAINGREIQFYSPRHRKDLQVVRP